MACSILSFLLLICTFSARSSELICSEVPLRRRSTHSAVNLKSALLDVMQDDVASPSGKDNQPTQFDAKPCKRLSVRHRLVFQDCPAVVSHTFLLDTQRFAPQPLLGRLDHQGKETGRSPGNFGPNSLVKILRCSSATCAGQHTSEHPWHIHPSSLTTATAMGSVLLARRHHFIFKTPSLVTTVKFLHKARLSSISLVRNQAPMIASARGLTGPCSTRGCSSSSRVATCSKGCGADCLPGPSPRVTDLMQSAPTRSKSWCQMPPALMCSRLALDKSISRLLHLRSNCSHRQRPGWEWWRVASKPPSM